MNNMPDEVNYRDSTPNNFPDDYDSSQVDQRVLLRTRSVREKTHGIDVRGAIAQAEEITSVVAGEAKEIAETTQGSQQDIVDRFNDQMAGNTDINEVIDARRPQGSDSYTTLGQRLDHQFGKDDDFRSVDEDASFMQRVYNDAIEQGVKASWFGAKGDNSTDDSLALQQAIDAAALESGVVVLKAEARYLIHSGLILPDNVPIIFICSGRAVIRAGALMHQMIFKSRETIVPRIGFIGVHIDANYLADFGIDLEASNDAFFDRVWIDRAKIANLAMGNEDATNAASYGASFRRVKITGGYNGDDPNLRSMHGVLLRKGASDNHIDDIIIRNTKNDGVRDESGNNVYGKVHVFGHPEPLMSPDYGLDLVEGKAIVTSGFFADGIKKAGIKARRGGFSVLGAYFFWRSDADWDKSETSAFEIDDNVRNYVIMGNVIFGKVGTDIKYLGNRSGVVFGNTCIDVLNRSRSNVYGQDVNFAENVVIGRDLNVLGKLQSKTAELENVDVIQNEPGVVFDTNFVGSTIATNVSLGLGTLVSGEIRKRWEIQKNSNTEDLLFISRDNDGTNAKTKARMFRSGSTAMSFYDGDAKIVDNGRGVVLTSKDGTVTRRLFLNNDGTIGTEPV